VLPERRRILLGAAVFLLVLGCGAVLWSACGFGLSRGTSAVLNVMLEHVPFDRGVRVELTAMPESHERQPGDSVDADTQVILRAEGYPGQAGFGMSLRRDLYLPLVIFLALTLALPLSARNKAKSLAAGVVVIAGVAAGSIYIVVAYLLAQRTGARPLEEPTTVISFLFERWLTPPGNRVIAPLLLALGLGAWFSRREPRARVLNADVAAPVPLAAVPANEAPAPAPTNLR